jgi:choline transport protein
MNYCIVAFAIVIIIATIQWFIDGRKNFHGPQIDLDLLKDGGVVAIDPMMSATDEDKKSDD